MNRTRQEFAETIAAAKGAKMNERQSPLIERYKADADQARITDHGRTVSTTSPLDMPLYTEIVIGAGKPVEIPVGVHSAVGGESDYPNPGDILCGALAGCLDSVIRIIANKLSVPLKRLEVNVAANIDVRGTLRIDDDVPVGFESIDVFVIMEPKGEFPDAHLDAILKAAEHSCVILQTLRNSPAVSITRQKEERNETSKREVVAA